MSSQLYIEPTLDDDHRMLNDSARRLFERSLDSLDRLRCRVESIEGASILDAGVATSGSIEAGIVLARLCLGDCADVTIESADPETLAVSTAVLVRTDHPLTACLGAQYAGWPVQSDDYFAMGSGPMRMTRGREEMLKELQLGEASRSVVGVLESDKLPSESAIDLISDQCGVAPESTRLAVAPTTSIAGCIQVVARSVETAMHKLHELKFDVRAIVSGLGRLSLIHI